MIKRLIEANKIINRLFKKSKNVLDIFIRGTDYITLKPKGHPIQPTPQMVIDILDYRCIY